MRTKLATINLQVSDPQRAKKFYVDVLGMVEDTRSSHPPAFVYLRSEGCDMTLALPQESSCVEPARGIELGFEVDDIMAMRTHLSKSGVEDCRQQSMGWGDALELRDGDGNRVLIYSFKKADSSSR